MNRLEAQRAIIAKTEEVIALARRLYPTYTHASPTISFDLKGRSCGGTALGYIRLRFNLDWYAANPADYLQNTVTHEIAHIVASATGLGRGHNRGWVRICLSLGGDGKRCATHSDIAAVPRARRVTEYLYRSEQGREVWIGPVHHKKLQARGDIMHPVTNRPMIVLNCKRAGRVLKGGFTGTSRLRD